MSSATLADRIRANRKTRSPVQDTVNDLFNDISVAIASGESFRNIHAQLTREGHRVGKGHTSLFAAFNAVKKLREQQSKSAPVSVGGAPQPVAAGAATMTSGITSAGQMPTAIVDARRKPTEW
jgi:hypothetical protein